VAWLVWHLARVQDDHVADVAGTEQRWTAGGWAERFGLPFAVADTGYGHSAEEVGAVRVDAELLAGYLADVHAATVAYLDTVTADDLDRVVDTHWDPPVTLGVRLVSVVADDLQHVGQAAYVRGLARRAGV
ncbi:MAG: mycothiol transferase, partial [Pseudonocardia sp.]